MISVRVATAVLAGVSLWGLAACGEEKTATTTAPVATSPAAKPAASTAATTAPAAKAGSDKELCQAADKAEKDMKAAMLTITQTTGGELSAADAKAMLTGFSKSLTTAAAGSDSKVAKIMTTIGAQAAKAAAAKDPGTAADTPEAEKSGKELIAACKAAGVTLSS
ncbi:hypothetical protein QLQ12_39670 [Actinoplanes sp. NEAU-A12]|uniref:Lipoprotein n=1 Tax=Actinoplanes sandaracinus TaxID=3045177 RepID=A0ABT6WYB3_9ACTN|nr:hypothetical protein [Actinoplanes sandaracinus]MDI6104727.1 hypothetical protein [Actinoplanes sandaracinus]